MRQWHRSVLRSAIAPLALSLLTGATWRVEQDGSGDFSVIQDAMSSAASGDTILVGPGRYADFHPRSYPQIGAAQAIMSGPSGGVDVTVIGHGAHETVIGPEVETLTVDGAPAVGLLTGSMGSGSTFENLVFENLLHAVSLSGSATFRGCVFRRCERNFIRLGGATVPVLRIEDSVFDGTDKDNQNTAIAGHFASHIEKLEIEESRFTGLFNAVELRECTDGSIQGCTFDDIAWYGVDLTYGCNVRMVDCSMKQIGTRAVQVSRSQASLIRCSFGPEADIQLQTIAGSTVRAFDCTFDSASYVTISICRDCVVDVNYSNIAGGSYSAVLSTATTIRRETMDFTNCHWGTFDRDAIEAMIRYSSVDDSVSLARIDFEPFLESPVRTSQSTVGSFKASFGQERQ